MALTSMTLDPNAASYTDDQIVGKVNTASAQITRSASVAAAARPLISAEVTISIIAANAVSSVAIAANAVSSACIAANAVTASCIAAAAVNSVCLASGVAKVNLDAMSDITRGYIRTNPVTGQFRVIFIERQADGKEKVEYDDVAIT